MEPVKENYEQKAIEEIQKNESNNSKKTELVEYATISFTFPMSRYEAKEILRHPKGKVMKSFIAYMNKIVVSAAKKYSEIPVGETVTDCKVPI